MTLNLNVFYAEAEEAGSGVDLLLPATSELVAGIAAFAIVFFFVWKWALPALNTTLEERAASIEGQIEAAEATKEAAIASELEFSGVSLDTEAAQLLEQQQAFQASARILSTARELFRTLLDVV